MLTQAIFRNDVNSISHEIDREYRIAKLSVEDASRSYFDALDDFTRIQKKRKKHRIKKPFIILLDYLKDKLH